MARITKKEIDEIKSLRRRFMDKTRRLIKKGVNPSELPVFPTFSPGIPRKLINEAKSQVKSFLNRFNQRWQFIKVGDDLVPKTVANEFKRLQRLANQNIIKNYNRNKDLPFIPMSERGWASPGAHRTVGQQHLSPPRLYSKKLSEFSGADALKAYISNLSSALQVSQEDRDEKWRDNTVKALQNVFGDASDDLISRIKAMPLSDFVLVMQTQDINISYVYLSLYTNETLDKIAAYFDVDLVKTLIKNYR